MEFQGVEVDHCLDCRGTWFDAGEVEFLAETAGVEPGKIESAIHASGQQTGELKCPRCRRRMQVLKVGQQPAVEVDRCPAGEGLWLDAGELAAVVKTFGGTQDAALAEFFGDLFKHELSDATEDA